MGARAGSRNSPTGSFPLQATVRPGERHQGSPHPPPRQRRFRRGGGGSSGAGDFSTHTWKALTVAGEGMPAAARGTTAPRTGGSTGDVGGGAAAEAAAAEAPRSAGSVRSRVQLPLTTPICPLNECFKCGKSGHVRQLCSN